MKLSMLLVTAILFRGGLFYFASCASAAGKAGGQNGGESAEGNR